MISAVAFDFAAKQLTHVEPGDVASTVSGGRYCWVDLGEADAGAAPALLTSLGVEEVVVERLVEDLAEGQFYLGRSCMHCTFVETRFSDGHLHENTVHVVLGDGFLATVHARPSVLMGRVLETYEDDFHATAESGGYLIFEIADHLISGYRRTLAALSTNVEAIQARLLGGTGDEIFADVAELTRALLEYRNAVVTARETLHELATRRSAFIKPSTQPFLEKQTVPLERLASDAATERTVLSESLNLYMGIVSHRTNTVVNRLTIVSMIFLPLNFLAALYGMNFEHMPELHWRFGYLAFWGVSAVLVGSLLLMMRRRRWI